MRTRDLKEQKAYWVSQFADEIPVLEMPLDHTRPQQQSYEGNATIRVLGEEVSKQIKELAAKTGTTEYMVFLSTLMVLLGKYSRQEDIVIGSPISGRTHKDTEGMLGMFINTLAMRGKPEKTKTYAEFLSEIKETCLKAYENQEYPFEELVEAVNVQRELSRNPLFDVMLAVQNNEEAAFELDGIKAEGADSEMTISKFDLTFEVMEKEGHYGINLEYCTALYEESTIQGMLDHLEEVLKQVVQNEKVVIGDIEMVTEEERETILHTFNHIEADYPREKTVMELFEEQVEKTPENIAVVFEDEILTYAELNAKANGVAKKTEGFGSEAG